MTATMLSGRRIEIRGTVQGVGFRPWVYRLARDRGIAGTVRNGADGVTIEAFAPEPVLDAFVRRLAGPAPPAARVQGIRWCPIRTGPDQDFIIAPSERASERRLSIPPDLATCGACAREVADPEDRRYRYAFTNCTDCGPRYTIALDVPYDRPATTMAGFAMCPRCRREYLAPEDRRFHAQPNACPECGPRLRLLAGNGEERTTGDPIRAAATALAQGLIVAVKGLGGFHLACDACSPAAVARLRRRKHRAAKPFAVMARDLEEARRLAVLAPEDEASLKSVERPIVLVPRRNGHGLAAEVAPGSPLVGLILPYTPLHQLLLDDLGGPVVLTSGNRSQQPIEYRDGVATATLRGIADLFLTHDRPIAGPCDDSVLRRIAGAPTLLRRSRGYVPRALPLPRPVGRPVLACGAQLKNTFCVAAGDSAYLGPHIGDLDGVEAFDAFRREIDRFLRLLEVEPEVVAHDLHPDYLSTHHARDMAQASGIEAVAVQHHHAHVVSAIAEHRIAGPVIGVAYDGTGFGDDGTSWGGELLHADAVGFHRLATFRPIALAGGDRAVREVWRLALAVLEDAFSGDPPLDRLALFRPLPPGSLRTVRRMLAGGVHCPFARGVGRLFDAVGALVLEAPLARYEGDVAIRLHDAADPGETAGYPFELVASDDLLIVDPRPTLRALVGDLIAGRGRGTVAARFHNTLVRVTVDIVHTAAREVGRLPVVLTGGCFQSPWLARAIAERLRGDFEVHLHRQVPPGDGGIALGQALVAAEHGALSCA